MNNKNYLKNLSEMLTTVKETEEYLDSQLNINPLPEALEQTFRQLRSFSEVIGTHTNCPPPKSEFNNREFLQSISGWRSSLQQQLSIQKSPINTGEPAPCRLRQPDRISTGMDHRFYAMMDAITSMRLSEVTSHIKEKFRLISPVDQKTMADYLVSFPYWGALNPAKQNFELLENRAAALKDHAADFLWLYKRLCDYRSKGVLYAILSNWFDFDFTSLQNAHESFYPDYFDCDLILCDSNEIFVDLGAFYGDTVASYLSMYGDYKRIYCYEITDDSFSRLQQSYGEFPNIILRKKGASDVAGKMYLSANPDASGNMLTSFGQIEVPTVTIDEDIREPVTFIKMDIEGAEQKALLGCADHIRADHPKLAICTYHNNEDIWKIPRMIEEIEPGYSFYMRHNGGNLIPTEYVLIALWQPGQAENA